LGEKPLRWRKLSENRGEEEGFQKKKKKIRHLGKGT